MYSVFWTGMAMPFPLLTGMTIPLANDSVRELKLASPSPLLLLFSVCVMAVWPGWWWRVGSGEVYIPVHACMWYGGGEACCGSDRQAEPAVW